MLDIIEGFICKVQHGVTMQLLRCLEKTVVFTGELIMFKLVSLGSV